MDRQNLKWFQVYFETKSRPKKSSHLKSSENVTHYNRRKHHTRHIQRNCPSLLQENHHDFVLWTMHDCTQWKLGIVQQVGPDFITLVYMV